LATNAAGGILVGLVTKHAGSVRKGFALIIGMFLSGVLQNVVGSERQVTSQQWAGGSLAALSLWLYTAYPMV
jgi:UDP-sugar transporter A1/2/3